MSEQQQDQAEREQLNYAIARRLHFAKMDGYLTDNEFEHVLLEMGILTNWKKEQHGKH